MRNPLFALNWRPQMRFWSSPYIHFAQARNASSNASRIDRITARLPRRLQKYTNGVRNAPISHVVSFLILHELTAIVPLFALFGLFHYTEYVPVSYMTQHFGTYVQDGLAKFERYFKRKGWFGFTKDGEKESESTEKSDTAMQRWHDGDNRYKVVVEIALAYAITKALLPIRIIVSVWATPWFARSFSRVKAIFTKKP